MNKNAIKKFAIDARNKLIASVTDKAGMLGITPDNCSEAITKGADFEVYKTAAGTEVTLNKKQCEQRRKLVDQIHARGFEAVVEEVAYTWFNRICAIRFMEVNDYMYPVRVRVLSSEKEGKNEPDVVTMAPDIDWDFTDKEREEIIDAKINGSQDELFRKLFLKQCNLLHEVLPGLFEGNEDYMEPLLTLSYTDKDGIIYHLIHDIEEDDFNVEKEGQVEIIGWLYQYYISEKHDEIINIYKGTIKKDDIPAATQLFTTDWVVRYMVDNSLGRYWIERNPQSKLTEKLKFFVTPKNGEIQYVNEKVSPTDLTFFDPCMGSGHILVYAFDVLMEIYREGGYSDRDAALNIVENNIFGMDIDKRAYQLAYFAVMMKARSYNRRALKQGIKNNLAIAEESNSIDKFECDGLTNNKEKNKIGDYLVKAYKDAREIGTLQTVEKRDYDSFRTYLNEIEKSAGQLNFLSTEWLNETLPLMFQLTKQAEIMSNKYAVVCTNPPYLNKLEGQLKEFVVDNYKEYSGDLFSVFIYRNFGYCKPNGYSAFMTPFVWMFIKSYQELRKYILENKSVVTLIQMEYSAFEEATVPICTFVLCNQKEKNIGLYIKLSEFKGGMDVQRKKTLEAIENPNCKYFYETPLKNFFDIEGVPFAFWASKQIRKAFKECDCIGKIAPPKQGLATADNNRFLRKWYEIDNNHIGFGCNSCNEANESGKKWFPYNKGGAFRRWYGNREYVVNWENDGFEIKHFCDEKGKLRSRPQNLQYYFKPIMNLIVRYEFSKEMPIKTIKLIYNVLMKICRFMTNRGNVGFDEVRLYQIDDEQNEWIKFADGFLDYQYDNFTEKKYQQNILFDDIDECIANLHSVMSADTEGKATYLFDFYSDNDKDYSILSDDKIKNICSSIECELDFVTDLKDDENTNLEDLIKSVKTLIKQHRKSDKKLEDKTYDMIFNSISHWGMANSRKIYLLYKKQDYYMKIFNEKAKLSCTEEDIAAFVKYRNDITHGRYRTLDSVIAATAYALMALAYCCFLLRMGIKNDKLKILFETNRIAS